MLAEPRASTISETAAAPDTSPVWLNAVLSSLPGAAVVVCDRTLRVVACHGQLLRQLSLDGGQPIGRDLDAVLGERGLSDHLPYYRNALDGACHKLVQSAATGSELLVRFGPVRDPDGQITGAMTITIDPHTQHGTEPSRPESYEQVAAERNRLRTAFESAAAGAAIATPDGVLVQVDATYAQIVGRTAEQLTGMHVSDITHPDDLEQTRAYFRACIDQGPRGISWKSASCGPTAPRSP